MNLIPSGLQVHIDAKIEHQYNHNLQLLLHHQHQQFVKFDLMMLEYPVVLFGDIWSK